MKNICLVLLLLVNVPSLWAQNTGAKPLQVVSQHTLSARAPMGDGSDVLLSDAGDIVGQYSPVMSDSAMYYRVRLDGGTNDLTVTALTSMAASTEGQRLLCYGVPAYRCTSHEANVRIYDTGSGALVRDLGVVAVWPFVIKMAKDGAFFVAGQTGKGVFSFDKYSKDGVLLWRKPIESGVSDICISESGDRYAIGIPPQAGRQGYITCFDASGAVLSEIKAISRFSDFKFLGNDKMIILDGRQFYMYNLQGIELLAFHQFAGNCLGRDPIAVNIADGSFAFVSADSPSNYLVSCFNASGLLTHERAISGIPVRLPWRMIRFLEDSNLQFTSDAETLVLQRGE